MDITSASQVIAMKLLSNSLCAGSSTLSGLDGSTSGIEREKLINQFNNPESKQIHLFLLSTR